MKFSCGEGAKARHKRLTNWHRKFALLPVQVGNTIYWLECVERRGEYVDYPGDSYWHWEYREAAK